jgi:hypothetical protein
MDGRERHCILNFCGKTLKNGYLENKRWEDIIKMAFQEIGCEVE